VRRARRTGPARRTPTKRTLETSLLGILLSMKHELRVMLAQGSGSIVNVSSTYGHGGAAYAACGDQTGGWRQEKGRAS
jgi:NAD(P)-dependent dehydrogenase (short-subunit alcohol dehydrogenase family)